MDSKIRDSYNSFGLALLINWIYVKMNSLQHLSAQTWEKVLQGALTLEDRQRKY